MLDGGVVTGGGGGVELLGVQRIGGGELDLSGLRGDIIAGVPHSLLGSFGSGIDWAGGDVIAVNDRGPADGASRFECRIQRFALEVGTDASNAGPELSETKSGQDKLNSGLGDSRRDPGGSQPREGTSDTDVSTSEPELRDTKPELPDAAPGGDGPRPDEGEAELHAGQLSSELKDRHPKLRLLSTVLLKGPSGEPLVGASAELGEVGDVEGASAVPRRYDPEGIRILPSGNLLICDEYGPRVDEFGADGRFVRAWAVPKMFGCEHPGVDEAGELPPRNVKGRQPNRGFEGLAVTASGRAIAMLQSPLIQDGGLNSKNKRVGLQVRVVEVRGVDAGGVGPQWVYELDKASHGVNEVLAVSESCFLTIERDGKDAKFRGVYLFSTEEATDVSGFGSLPGVSEESGLGSGARSRSGEQGLSSSAVVPVRKRMLIDLLDPAYLRATGTMPEKIEGLCFGPDLLDGRRMLIVSSDNDMEKDEDSVVWYFAVPKDLLMFDAAIEGPR